MQRKGDAGISYWTYLRSLSVIKSVFASHAGNKQLSGCHVSISTKVKPWFQTFPRPAKNETPALSAHSCVLLMSVKFRYTAPCRALGISVCPAVRTEPPAVARCNFGIATAGGGIQRAGNCQFPLGRAIRAIPEQEKSFFLTAGL